MDIKKIFVIGAGAMGAGIAQTAAVKGFHVILNDVTMYRVEKAKMGIEKQLIKNVEKGIITEDEKNAALERLILCDSYDKVAEADLVIEAIYENIDAKKKIFKEIDKLKKENAILASNTSSLSLTSISSVLEKPENFIGMHFFNPVPVMKLLEIVVGLSTSQETIATALKVGEMLGKETIIAKDSPGFIVNRALVVMLNEAICMYDEGVGTAEDIDKGMMLGCNHPMGPLELMDMIGIEIILAVMESFHRDFGDSKYRPSILLRKMVAAGRFGRKTGRGFYTYDKNGRKIKSTK